MLIMRGDGEGEGMNRRGFIAALLGATATAATVAVSPAPTALVVSQASIGPPGLYNVHEAIMRRMSEEISREMDRDIIEGLIREARP